MPTPPAPTRHTTLYILTLVNAAGLLLLYLAESFVAERCWLTALLAYLPQQPFFIPVAILLCWSLLRRQWRLVGWNAVVLVGALVAVLGVNVPWPTFGAAAGTPVRVMTYNIHAAATGAARTWRAINRVQPDVIVVQEDNGPQRLAQSAPSGWRHAEHVEVAVLSRYPIIAQHNYPVTGTSRVMLATTLDVHGARLTVLNVHLSTATTGESLFHHKGSLRGYLHRTTAVRGQQIAMIRRIVSQSPDPVIVAGDFNTPPRGILYRRMTQLCDDAFHVSGWGVGFTYPTRLPLLRIDHLFLSKGIIARRCWTPAFTTSDHRPLVADVVLPR